MSCERQAPQPLCAGQPLPASHNADKSKRLHTSACSCDSGISAACNLEERGWLATSRDDKANAIPRYDERLDARAGDRDALALAMTDHGRSDCLRSHDDPLRLWSINRFNYQRDCYLRRFLELNRGNRPCRQRLFRSPKVGYYGFDKLVRRKRDLPRLRYHSLRPFNVSSAPWRRPQTIMPASSWQCRRKGQFGSMHPWLGRRRGERSKRALLQGMYASEEDLPNGNRTNRTLDRTGKRYHTGIHVVDGAPRAPQKAPP